MKKPIYVKLDADNIGDSIELALLNNNIEEAIRIHNLIQESIKKLVVKINDCGYKILMIGCDDILFSVEFELFDETNLLELMEFFNSYTNFSLSMGVGISLNEALLNLRKAKISGKNKIVKFQE